ncbi:radical SAM protein [Candidatus Saganbacteria bacterium]|nr:radical SAM protein [Candidatus Saganbacteria bacterium]
MSSEYKEIKKLNKLPRLPLEGSIDLTYRCDNNCRHCWLRLSPNAQEKKQELSFDEIKNIIDQARKLGNRKWSISGGEPMLRPDFSEIFDYITSHSISYSLNTNGGLITPAIARLMKRQGNKMIAVYGATREVHDHITRNPGSYDATMRGFAYLKEAGGSFTVQLIPMKDNYHQYDLMVKLAQSLSKHYRIGAPWLYLSASGDPIINEEIKKQRLYQKDVIELDKPSLSYEEKMEQENAGCAYVKRGDDRLFAACIANRRDFHVDPYGQMTFCSFIKDPKMRYDLRTGTVKEGWDKFIPSLADKVRGTKDYLEGCAVCEDRKNCRWCPVYGYLEHGDFSKKMEYLCAVAKENKDYKKNWQKEHRTYYQIGGITIQVESDLPITDKTFHPKLAPFHVAGPGADTVYIHHHFALPDLEKKDLGKRLYSKPPWSIYKKDDTWIYLGISPSTGEKDLHKIAVFNADHSRGQIYHPNDKSFKKGDLSALTSFFLIKY